MRTPLYKGDVVDYLDGNKKMRGIVSSNNSCAKYSTAFQVVPYEMNNKTYIAKPKKEKMIDYSQIIRRVTRLTSTQMKKIDEAIVAHHKKDGNFKIGEVYFANLPKAEGSIQSGERPVLVVSGEEVNGKIHVIPFSSKAKKVLPTHIYVSQENSILVKDSVLLAEAEMLINTENLIGKLGEFDKNFMQEVLECIKIQHGIA